MSITFQELVGVQLDQKSGRIPYKCITTASESAVAIITALAAYAPSTWGGMPLSNCTIDDDTGTALWFVSASYGQAGGSTTAPETGEAEIDFEVGGATQHITHAEDHIADYGATPPDMEGIIGANGDSIDGVDIAANSLTFNVTHYVDASSMTSTYIGKLVNNCARSNAGSLSITASGITATFAAGEVLYVGARISRRMPQGDWIVALRFWASPNLTSITIKSSAGDITVTSKKGTEYLWVRYRDQKIGFNTVKQAISAHVEQVYKTCNFSELNP